MQSLNQRDIDRLLAACKQLKFTTPEITYLPWLNKITGVVQQIPVGVDPSWDYNPGKVAFLPPPANELIG